MDNAKEYAAPANADLSVRGVKENEQSAVAQPKFATETIKLGESRNQRSFDWQACVKDHPYLTLGLTAGAGMLLMGLLKPRPSAKKQLITSLSSNLAGTARRLDRRVGKLAEKPARVGTSIKAATTTMAAKALKSYLKRRLINAFTPSRKRRMWF